MYPLLIMLLLLLAVAACIVIYSYRTCFYAPRNRREDPYALLDGAQYRDLAEGIFYCTRKMEEAPCAFVQTRSHDGLLLSGRYCNDLAQRFSYSGISPEVWSVCPEIPAAAEALKAEGSEDLYVVTCFSDRDKLMTLSDVRKEAL